MRFMPGLFACACLFTAGCGQTAADEERTRPSDSDARARAVALTPENTQIQFVGTHTGDRPDPRTGGFEKFKGTMELDPKNSALKSVAVEIDTSSLWTEIPNLTTHLKSADFFEVRQYPTATFKSSRIKLLEGDKYEITGKLTLHGVTKEISFPATLKASGSVPVLKSEFSIDRTEFGMTWGPERVENKVVLSVTVGEKTKSGKAASAAGRPGQG